MRTKHSFLLAPALFAQNAKPNAPDEHPQPCVIVKRHVHKFGENMSRLHRHRPFDYVEGDYPPGFEWRSELSDGDVRELQKKGGRTVVPSPDYQLANLGDLRKQCKAPAATPQDAILKTEGASERVSVLQLSRQPVLPAPPLPSRGTFAEPILKAK